jgi:hypothetical protein
MCKKTQKCGKKRNICGLFSAGSATNLAQLGTWTAEVDLASARPGLASVEFMFDFLKGFGGEATRFHSVQFLRIKMSNSFTLSDQDGPEAKKNFLVRNGA